jgi:capsular polysaccharide biosynthesis protein
VRDALVVAATGIAYSSDGRVLAEASSWPAEAVLARNPAPPGPPLGGTIEGTCLLLPDNGFYHWLVEDLPAFLLARERVPDATVIVPRRSRPYVTEALSLLKVDALPFSGTVQVRELVIAGRGPVTGWGAAEDVAALRVFRASMHQPDAAPRDLYVSRRRSRRSPANEPELERAFTHDGYTVIYPERMSLDEQIRAFWGARRIAGPHGAGLAGMVWADPGASVQELADPAYVNLCYVALAQACGHDYESVLGIRSPEWTVHTKGL